MEGVLKMASQLLLMKKSYSLYHMSDQVVSGSEIFGSLNGIQSITNGDYRRIWVILSTQMAMTMLLSSPTTKAGYTLVVLVIKSMPPTGMEIAGTFPPP